MSDNSKVEWCDATWNPITGCTPISAGCAHCYAKRMAQRLAGRFGYPADEPFKPGTDHPSEWTKPQGWRKARRVFVCSMGDLFHEAVTDAQIQMVLDYCAKYSQHTYQILTKRPERCITYNFPANVWLGTTVENEDTVWRIGALKITNAKVHFLSCEPLLDSIWLSPMFRDGLLHWVIVGAETGPGKRRMELDWARRIRDDCDKAGVPFFFKKDSAGNGTLDGAVHHAFPQISEA